MSRAPWGVDHELDADRFARILERRFPEFVAPEVVALPFGWDYMTFRVDGDWVFKVPKRASVVSRMRQEVSLLTALPRMTAAVPRPAFHGVAASDLPHPFFGYPYIEGRFATAPGVDVRAVIRQAFDFLEALHAIVPPFAVEGPGLGGWSQQLAGLKRVRAQVEALAPSLAWLAANEPPPSSRKVLLHDDLGPEHLLLEPDSDRLRAVLDWADASRGDPARDLIALLLWQPALTAEEHAARGGDAAELRRAQAYALMHGLHILEEHLRWAPERAEDWIAQVARVQGSVVR